MFVVQVHLDDCLRGLVKTYLTKLDPENMLELSSQSMVKRPQLPKSKCNKSFQNIYNLWVKYGIWQEEHKYDTDVQSV